MFTFTWSIENFSLYLQSRDEFISSPAFKIGRKDTKGRQLILYPREKDIFQNETVFIRLVPDDQLPPNVKISILSEHLSKTTVHEYKTSKIGKNNPVRKKGYQGLSRQRYLARFFRSRVRFNSLEILKKDNFYLPGDTLTIELEVEFLNDFSRIWTKQFTKSTVEVESHIIKVAKNKLLETGPRRCICSKIIKTQEKLLDSAEFEVEFYNEADDNLILITVKCLKSPSSKIYSRCKILSGDIEIEISKPEYCFLQNNNFAIWRIIFSKNELEAPYIEFDTLLLRFDFTTGVLIHTSNVIELVKSSVNHLPSPISSKPNSSAYFESIYKSNKFCDVVLKTSGTEFLGHKCVLRASSSFFDTIIKNTNSKEFITIEIKDLDVHIVDKMLLFMYTRTIENPEFDDIINLYSASMKFQIPELIKKCSIYILENISVKYICQILELADMYQDNEMKKVFRDFIFTNHKEIFSSNSWKNLMEKQPQLTKEIMVSFCINHGSYFPYNSLDEYVSSTLAANQTYLKIQKLLGEILNDMNSSSSEFFKCIYTNKKFSDVILKVENIEFPAHKFVLCTFSPVFEAMFENNMKEKETNIVDICDVDEQIINKMLLFMYTKTVENINVSVASKLYYVAYKYQISELQEECSRFIRSNITAENAYEILELANLYQDQEMENVVRNFIQENNLKVIFSENWKDFKKIIHNTFKKK